CPSNSKAFANCDEGRPGIGRRRLTASVIFRRVMEQSFALFETAIGTCGVVGRARGIVGVQLPETDAAATRARVRCRYPKAGEAPPPQDVKRAIDGIVALLGGEKRDLTDI